MSAMLVCGPEDLFAAMQQKNPGAVVSAIRQLDHMTGIGFNSHRGHGVRL